MSFDSLLLQFSYYRPFLAHDIHDSYHRLSKHKYIWRERESKKRNEEKKIWNTKYGEKLERKIGRQKLEHKIEENDKENKNIRPLYAFQSV